MEALTLPHADGSFEIACNLLNTTTHGTTTQQVYDQCCKLIGVINEESHKSSLVELRIGASYATSPSLSELASRASNLVS